MKARKLPSGNWCCRATANGVTRSFTDFTKAAAEHQAAAWKNQKSHQRNPDNISVKQTIEHYINSRDAVLAATTISEYRKTLRLYFEPIENISVGKIGEQQVQCWINDLSKSLSPKTVRNIYGLFNTATKLSLNIALPQKKKIIYKTPDTNSIQKILKAAKGKDIELPILLAVWCGLRMSEIRGIKWSKINKEHIVIDEAKVYIYSQDIVKGTKTMDSERVISIHKYIYECIQKQQKDGEYLINLSPNMITKRFKKILKENNIPDCRFHDLRHANASIMLMLGVPNKYAMERGGWSTDDVLQNIYQQTYRDEHDIINDKIDSYFMDLLNQADKNCNENCNAPAPSLLN
ncbi:MAG: site-specific integrase [Oscillospiraceae bacterium]